MSQAGTFEAGNPAIPDIQFLQGDSGGLVGPNGGGVIFLLGESDIVSVVGNPGTNTLTINMVGILKQTVTTVDDTPTTLFSYSLINNSAVSFTCVITAVQDTYAAAINGEAIGMARRAGGGAVLVGTPIVDWSPRDFATAEFDLIVSGNDLVLEVTGEAATTITWFATINIEII